MMDEESGRALREAALSPSATEPVCAVSALPGNDQPRGSWRASPQDDLGAALELFRGHLPGWWYSLGECSVSADASCGPDRDGPDAHLLKMRLFDGGFHADLEQPATLAEALRNVTYQGIEARAVALASTDIKDT